MVSESFWDNKCLSSFSCIYILNVQTPSCHSDQQLTFFEESEIYWKPASDSASLYEQLAKNKYREILRHQIQ